MSTPSRIRITRNQWRALDKLRTRHDEWPVFPPQPYPWGFHNGTWTSLWRRRLVEFVIHSDVCRARLTKRGRDALLQYEPRL